jgi:hypothetical protein
MSLTNHLIEGLLPEAENNQTTAVYAGGFKPPTKGHFEVVEEALKQNPEIDEFIIFIGNKERNGISQEEALLIWEVYNNYLPFKVKLEPTSVPPIKAVYDFAKNHPTREILWIIGAREGNDEDFKDISARTTSISKYPNLELRTIVTQGGVSGTAARNASKISLEKFLPFLPAMLNPEEQEEVYNIVADKIQENDPEDGKAAPYGSGYKKLKENNNIKYTNPNFNTEWEEAERYSEFVKIGKKGWLKIANQGKPVFFNSIKDKLGNVDLNFDGLESPKKKRFIDAFKKGIIEMPIAVKFSSNDYDLVAGNTRLSGLIKQGVNPKIWIVDISKQTLNENASYKQHIDIQNKIDQLTQYMLDKGMNIEPLPSLEFVDGDSENAKDFFGKTAYYDPNKQHIVLYTEGRHPKDIVRSYAHEMIHHIQHLEDRLGDIPGTDTTSSEHLTKLEKEANLKGTMTFRNWTDSLLNEAIVGDKIECDNCEWSWKIADGGNDLFICHKCGHDNEPISEDKKKDPFGLLAYAQELGRLREDKSEYKVYLDMDGVLADFDQRFRDLSGMEPSDFESKYGRKAFWNLIDEEHKIKFWVGIKPMDGASALVDAVKDYDYELLTSPSAKKQSYLGKRLWVRNHIGNVFPSKPIINFKKAKEKHQIKSELSKTDILIDDREDTIGRWNAAGGTGIVYKSIGQVLNDLKKLGL